ncbi:MAG: O-antigen ligase family protein [Microgenomates group bacterium]
MTFIIFFLGSILFSLWFNEMRQGTIEVVWTALTLLLFLLYCIQTYKKGLHIFVPNTWGMVFLAVLVTIGISTVYSASPAYSLSFILRTLTAWCIFAMLFSLPKKESYIVPFAKGALYIGASIAILSICVRFFPKIADLLPAMNLIFSHSGHNQAANLLVTCFPIAVHYALHQKKKIIQYIAYALFPLAIILCFSRGAALIAATYIVITAMRTKNTKIHAVVRILIAAFFSVTLLLFVTSFLTPKTQQQIQTLPFGFSQMSKSTPIREARFSNWKQAIAGFISHPLIGTGPGTYILTSMRHHETPVDGAGFAHNWYLQTLSEVGIIGSVPIGIILLFVTKKLWQKRKNNIAKHKAKTWATTGLIDSVYIALAYSIFEYNLDYFTLWIFLWGTVGILLDVQKKNTHTALSKGITIASLLILGVYAGTTWYAATRLNTIETAGKRFAIQPYDINRTERYIEYKNSIRQPLTKQEKTTILWWHRAHPDVLVTLANASVILLPEERIRYYETALTLNPLNAYYYQSYMTFLYEQQKLEEMHHVFIRFIKKARHMTPKADGDASSIVEDNAILPYLTPKIFLEFLGTASFPEVASRSLYFIGLSSLSTAPILTEKLWSLARDISPSWGLFHRELASYYIYSAKNNEQAWKTLVQCQTYDSPREACEMEMDIFPDLPLPGELQSYIRMIPAYE